MRFAFCAENLIEEHSSIAWRQFSRLQSFNYCVMMSYKFNIRVNHFFSLERSSSVEYSRWSLNFWLQRIPRIHLASRTTVIVFEGGRRVVENDCLHEAFHEGAMMIIKFNHLGLCWPNRHRAMKMETLALLVYVGPFSAGNIHAFVSCFPSFSVNQLWLDLMGLDWIRFA